MGTWEILIIVFASLLVLSVSLTTLIKKVRGKKTSGCGGCCSSCPYACGKKEEK
ncbi:MAG: hypothetical protein IKC60_01715 [Clostridia bacterium]|nr:hypothetical protein [Clostridia bacterium]